MTLLRAGLGVLAAGSLLAAVPAAQPASAASTFSCPGHGGKAYMLAVGATSGSDLGYLWAYNYSAPSTDTAGTFGTRAKIGSGWNVFSTIRAGKDGFVWAFKTDGSIYYYDWNVGPTSTTWATTGAQPVLPSGTTIANAPWKSYATSTYRGRIAVDAGNNIYILDTSGRVRKYTYDIAGKKWTNFGKVVASLGTSYDLLWVSDQNTLYARNTNNNVLRLRLDPGADRQVTRFEGYPGWNSYKNVSSAGGDTLYGIGTSSGVRKWRFDEDTTTWPSSLPIATSPGWAAFLDVTTIGNSCVRSYPATAQLQVPTATDTPLEALGTASSSTVGVALANGVGGLRFATFDPTAGGADSLSWPADVNDGPAVTGQPALTTDATNKFHLFSHETTGVTKEKAQASAGSSPTLGAATSHGGVIAGTTDAVRLTDGTTVLTAADSAGVVWARQEYGGVWSSWRQVATGARPAAPVTATETVANQATLTYPLAGGGVGTVVVTNGATTGTATTLSVPGTGTSGRVAAMTYPGGALRLAVTDSSGALWTRAQDIATKAWAPDWTQVTTADGSTVVGDPAVVLSPTSSRVQILVRRSADDRLAVASESSQGSNTFGQVDVVSGGPDRALVTSPTTYTYLDPNNGTPVRRWGVVAYDIDRNVVDFHTTGSTPSPTGRSAGTAEDTLVGRVIGTLPTR